MPWHSTISCTRQLFPADVFERLSDHVFAQCVARGLVASDTQAGYSAPVKANASLEVVREKNVAGPQGSFLATGAPAAPAPAASLVTAPAHQLLSLAVRQVRLATQSSVLGTRREKVRLLSNKTHYSPTDPDARISIKPGKAGLG